MAFFEQIGPMDGITGGYSESFFSNIFKKRNNYKPNISLEQAKNAIIEQGYAPIWRSSESNFDESLITPFISDSVYNLLNKHIKGFLGDIKHKRDSHLFIPSTFVEGGNSVLRFYENYDGEYILRVSGPNFLEFPQYQDQKRLCKKVLDMQLQRNVEDGVVYQIPTFSSSGAFQKFKTCGIIFSRKLDDLVEESYSQGVGLSKVLEKNIIGLTSKEVSAWEYRWKNKKYVEGVLVSQSGSCISLGRDQQGHNNPHTEILGGWGNHSSLYGVIPEQVRDNFIAQGVRLDLNQYQEQVNLEEQIANLSTKSALDIMFSQNPITTNCSKQFLRNFLADMNKGTTRKKITSRITSEEMLERYDQNVLQELEHLSYQMHINPNLSTPDLVSALETYKEKNNYKVSTVQEYFGEELELALDTLKLMIVSKPAILQYHPSFRLSGNVGNNRNLLALAQNPENEFIKKRVY
jgi:hypothetical protein